MSLKYYIHTFFVSLLTLQLVTGRSFTIVLDTTVSMQDEIDVIRLNIASITGVMKNSQEFNDFIIVPFNDPDVGPPIISANPDSLGEFFNSISASGGNDCPEDSLAGIQQALENSTPNSIVYVFTDAYAKDITKFKDIENLCKNTRSQVVIFLTGGCSGSDLSKLGYVDIYYDIAKSCSGAVFKFDSVNLRKAFSYMKEMIKTDWNDIINHEPFSGHKQFSINVDSFTSDLLLAISGNYPTLQIVDSNNRSPDVQKIVDTRQSLVVRVENLRPGQYQASIRCQGLTSLTFYKKSRVPYQYGFSTRLPNSLKETSFRPMPGRQNYMLIVVPQDYNFKIISMELQMADGTKKMLSTEESQIREGFYTTSLFVEPTGSFRILIHGRDSSYQETTTTTKVIEPQVSGTNAEWSKPVVEILDKENNLIHFGTNATMVCKVTGYPKPEIVWEYDDETNLITEELLLEMPSVYLSYVTLNATTNHTMYCKATNKKGSDQQYTDLFVNRTFSFDVIQTPQNENFEYGSEGKLYCQVNAYPEADIKWSHNGSYIEYNDNIEAVTDDNALVIKNMTLNDVGLYECTISNEVRTETYQAEVSISGLVLEAPELRVDNSEIDLKRLVLNSMLKKQTCTKLDVNTFSVPEAPELEVDNSEIDLKPGDWFDTECRVVRGNPAPEVIWKYQSPNGNDFDSVPSDVYTDGAKLKISAVNKEHKGIYKCVATNMLGEDSIEITFNIKCKIDDGTLSVKEGDMVEIPCEVDSTPEATVRWEAQQGDTMLSFDSRHAIDNRNTLRFNTLWKDSGIYRCLAENEVGRTEKIVTVNVLVGPYIQPTESQVVNAASGSNVTLPCNVLYGNPVPSTKWEFIATDSTASVFSRGHSTTANLYLNNVSSANEGMYLCIADNEIGNDRIRMYLRVI